MEELGPLNTTFWSILGVSVACGGLIGLERQLNGKPAGIRTSILICMGTAWFIRLGLAVSSTSGDPARVLGQIVAGIGFLGAGVIITKGGTISGVTSAAVVWMLAALGATIGFGYYVVAISSAGATVAILVGVHLLERGFAALRRGVHASPKNEEDCDETDSF